MRPVITTRCTATTPVLQHSFACNVGLLSVTFLGTIVSLWIRRRVDSAASVFLYSIFGNCMKRFFVVLLCLVAVPLLLQAQRVDKSFYYDYGERFYYDVVNVPSPEPNATRFLVFFRMRNDVLTFTTVKAHYEASPLLYIEFIDSTGVITVSREWHSTVTAASYEQTQSRKAFVSGGITVDIPPGTYTVAFELGDNAAPRSKRFKETGIRGKDFYAGNAITPPLFAAPEQGDKVFQPFIFKGNIAFPSDVHALISVGNTSEGEEYTYSVEQASEEGHKVEYDDPLVLFSPLWGTVTPEMQRVLALQADEKKGGVSVRNAAVQTMDQEPISSVSRTGAEKGVGLLDIPLPSSSMSTGKYVLKVCKKGTKDTLIHPFSLVWEDKPLSLRNVQYAVELAYYIMTDEEYDEVNSGSLAVKRRKLYAFWQGKDPASSTVFNEAMAEYYSRVDYAYFNFQTLSERDGARTERGKIYILHGPPTSVDRKLEPDKPVLEVWRYDNNIAKEFVFESPSPGIFTLKGMRDI